ncbi:MAG: zinc ribbon domain-containing protein, partial [Roseiflexus sp.]
MPPDVSSASSGGGFGLPPAAPPTTPSTGGGSGAPPSGSGFGLPPTAPPPVVGSGTGAPAATTPAKKGPNWLLIIGIIFGVLVLACILILGGLYWIGQQAAQSLGTTVAGTVVSIGDQPASNDFPNVQLRDSLANEATSQFTAGQTASGDYRFENGAYVIESFETDQIVWQVIDGTFSDASFEIEATVDKPRSTA